MISIVSDEEGTMADASAWLARLQRDDVSEVDASEFAAWLAASPANAAAYRRALALWHEYETGADAVLADLDRRGRTAPRPGISRRWLVGGGGFAVAAGLAIAVLPSLLAEPAIQTYATGKGQHQRITLTDGSVVDLDAETKLSVSFNGRARRVTLSDGEAIFDVAHDADRPFTVEASSRIVRVVGTQFDVRNRHDGLSVTVARGKVDVRPTTTAASGRAFLLTPGQKLEIDGAGLERLSSVDPQEAFGWRSGRLVYRAEPLANVVADLNRQFVDQIEVSDPVLARTPVTGVIVLDNQASVVARLSLMLPIRSIPSGEKLLLLRK
jgi:transmembrane sensor